MYLCYFISKARPWIAYQPLKDLLACNFSTLDNTFHTMSAKYFLVPENNILVMLRDRAERTLGATVNSITWTTRAEWEVIFLNLKTFIESMISHVASGTYVIKVESFFIFLISVARLKQCCAVHHCILENFMCFRRVWKFYMGRRALFAHCKMSRGLKTDTVTTAPLRSPVKHWERIERL